MPVKGDLLDETDETFTVNLSGAGNATIADGPGPARSPTTTRFPTLSINDVTVTEGNTGTVAAVFTVGLGAPAAATSRSTYATANGTAVAPARLRGRQRRR